MAGLPSAGIGVITLPAVTSPIKWQTFSGISWQCPDVFPRCEAPHLGTLFLITWQRVWQWHVTWQGVSLRPGWGEGRTRWVLTRLFSDSTAILMKKTATLWYKSRDRLRVSVFWGIGVDN